MIELTLIDPTINQIYQNIQCISATDYEGYIVDATFWFPNTFKFDQIKLLLDLNGRIKIIGNPQTLKKRKRRRLAKKLFKLLLNNDLLTMYDNPTEPFQEFTLRKNIPVDYEKLLILDRRLFGG